MTSWVEHTKRKARIIHDQIAGVRTLAIKHGVNPEEACASFYALLDDIYGDDMALAKAMDLSDLLLHYEGKAISDSPRLSVVSYIFQNVKGRVTELTKAIAGLDNVRLRKGEIDLGLSGLARGSLYVGFTVPGPNEGIAQMNVLGDEEPVYKATKAALRALGTVSRHIELNNDPVEAQQHLSAYFPDPKIRDAALLAIRRLAPSQQSGIARVGIGGRELGDERAVLTLDVRRQANKMLQRPVLGREEITLHGLVREIDLDAHRFELRNISGYHQDVRCIYSAELSHAARKWLDAKVSVSGIVERLPDEAPRLLQLTNLEVLKNPE